MEEVAGGGDREHRGDGAPGRRAHRAQSDQAEGAPRPQAAGARQQLPDRVAQAAALRVPAPGVLVEEGLADAGLNLLVHDRLRRAKLAADSGRNSSRGIGAVRRLPAGTAASAAP